ncbi:hypothetical protein IQ07DRAFT_43489 [Pyrenochaeta sp. DS3sAY3a]|nr:hypothetical protein IQ07DRAFT_43489 [Pyrenochaeta sp. DS3sAY3a]
MVSGVRLLLPRQLPRHTLGRAVQPCRGTPMTTQRLFVPCSCRLRLRLWMEVWELGWVLPPRPAEDRSTANFADTSCASNQRPPHTGALRLVSAAARTHGLPADCTQRRSRGNASRDDGRRCTLAEAFFVQRLAGQPAGLHYAGQRALVGDKTRSQPLRLPRPPYEATGAAWVANVDCVLFCCPGTVDRGTWACRRELWTPAKGACSDMSDHDITM